MRLPELIRRLAHRLTLLLTLALAGLPVLSIAEGTQTIRIPQVAEHPERYRYYADVLTAAIAYMDDDYTLEMVGPVTQVRAQSMLMSGDLDVMWAIQSAQRDELYLPTDVGIVENLIGQRVLLIRPEDQPRFQFVETLEDFRGLGLTVGFGQNWVDTEIWNANDLSVYEEQGNWEVMFQKLARDRGDFDYLSRSVIEVLPELSAHPQLALERRLLLVYDADETFYVSPGNPELQEALATTLPQVKESGELHALIRQYWGTQLDALNTSNRTVIPLDAP